MNTMEKLEGLSVDELINCQKFIIDKDPKLGFKHDQQHYKADLDLVSVDKSRRFRLFIRQHAEFKHNFTIGLDYKGRLGDVKLIRFNGPHKRLEEEIDIPHYHCHIHREKDPENSLNTLKDSFVTSDYESFDEALMYALQTVNVENISEYFLNIDQMEISLGNTDE